MQNICDATHHFFIMPIEVASGPNFGYDNPHARHFYIYTPHRPVALCIAPISGIMCTSLLMLEFEVHHVCSLFLAL